jgi:molybdenum cofactor biosynthesis enzyme MoaA
MESKKRAIFLDAVVLKSCNLKCRYCRNELFLSREELAELMKNVRETIKIQSIVDYDIFKISGYGEVTLSTDLDELVDITKDKRLQIITNGTRLDRPILDS